MSSEGPADFVRVLIAWVLPPVAVFLQVGFRMQFWICCLLSLVFVVPGQVYALWVISSVGPGGKAAKSGGPTFLALLLTGLFPPAAVAMRSGVGVPLLINCVATLFAWLPGVLHATWVVCNANDR